MRPPNPLSLKISEPKNIVIFAASQIQGKRKTQEDFFINFNDECFVLADGVGGLPHGAQAAKLAAETAIWGYKLIRQRKFYWLDKKLFMKRIFRSTNITVWQKQRESGFEGGLATTLEVLIVGEQYFWIGHVGDSSCWFLSADSKAIKKLTTDDSDQDGNLTKVVGKDRYGLIPQYINGPLSSGDSILMVSDGITKVLSPGVMQKIIENAGVSTDSLSNAVVSLLESSESAGGTDNMTAILVKRIANR